MLQLSRLREDSDTVIARLRVKGFEATALVEQVLERDRQRRELQGRSDALLSEGNAASKQIGQLLREGKQQEAAAMKERSTALREEVRKLSEDMAAAEVELNGLMVQLPNVPHEGVPAGRSAADNVVIREGGTMPSLAGPLPHWEIATKYNLISFELGNKVTGTGFPVYMGRGARLQRALIGFFLDKAVKAGYKEVQPPILVNEASAFGTGQLPDKDAQMYHVGTDNLYVIPTAEVPLTNLYRDVILEESELPVKLAGYTPCFRREAGSYGKDVRGLNRLHQFDKVEIVQVRRPEDSYRALEEMVDYVAGLLGELELPYRVVKLCGGDMSFTSALTYDMEVYSAGQEKWLEVSSVSNFESYQSVRLGLRYREGKKIRPAHTLNGSALALPRIVAALLENNYGAGGVKLPGALAAYAGFEVID